MENIVLAVLKGGEVVLDFAGEIAHRLRGDSDEDDDGSEAAATDQTEPQ